VRLTPDVICVRATCSPAHSVPGPARHRS
jgi:hypothetical protein